jgi:threonine synthase
MLMYDSGNHGRAVAKTASLLNLPSRIYVPSTTEQWSRDSMGYFGASCIVVQGDYDAAYRQCAEDCFQQGAKGILVQDTSWEGYEDIPMVNPFTINDFPLSVVRKRTDTCIENNRGLYHLIP